MLNSVQTAVTATVSETVKAEIKTYSDVVKESTSGQTQITSETLKSVVKNTMQEEDRSKNLIVFGLVEQENEDLQSSIGEVFSQLGVKPISDLSRVGKSGNKERPRPVKVVLSCASTARSVLYQARKLKNSEKFKSVFIRPDRTLEERATHKQLIEEVKNRRKFDPGKKHFIKGGQVISEDKSDN